MKRTYLLVQWFKVYKDQSSFFFFFFFKILVGFIEKFLNHNFTQWQLITFKTSLKFQFKIKIYLIVFLIVANSMYVELFSKNVSVCFLYTIY